MTFDPYYRWLGISFKDQPPNHYRLLAIELFEPTPDVIEAAADRLMAHLRNYQSGKHSDLSQQLLNEISAARVCLLNAEKKAAYDRELQAQLKAQKKAIPTAKPLETEPEAKPVDAGLEKLFEETSHAKPLAHTPTPRNKQTQLWTAAGIVGVGLVALVFILIRVSGTSSSKPATPGTSPVAKNDPAKAQPAQPLAKKPVEPEKPQPATPVNKPPEPIQGNGPAPPLAMAPFDAAKARECQEAWAKYLGVPVVGTNSIGMKFALIPPGEFDMGSTEEEVERLKKVAERHHWEVNSTTEFPEHRVKITKPFYLGLCEVTQGQWEQVTKSTPGKLDGDPTLPVNSVTWHDAVAFCRSLSELPEETASSATYRLPTEAEWEYSCRAGTQTRYGFADDTTGFDQHAWWRGNAHGKTRPVGSLTPNAWRLFDMQGNVFEWCADWHAADYYARSPIADPTGPESGTHRIQRGGSCARGVHDAFRCAYRSTHSPSFRGEDVGFRVVLMVTPGRTVLEPAQTAQTDAVQNPATPAPPVVEKPARLPAPSAEDQAKVAAQLKELFELDKDRKPAEQKKLAADLVNLAGKSDKPAERYVLLVTAAQLSCQAGDGAAALRVVDKLAEAFDVDPLALKTSLIKRLATEAGDGATIGAMLDAADKVIDAAIAAGKYDVALELVEEAYKACAQGTGRDHRKRAFDRRKEVQTLAASWQKVQAVLEKLKTTPDDPEANLAAGQYYCFEQGEWTKGLPCLAKSSNAELKKLAEEELNSPPSDNAAMLKLADAWWHLAETRKDADHDALLLRAGTWYREARPAIASTLVKAKVDKRLETITKLGKPIPEPALLGPPPPAVAPFDAAQAKRYQERWAKYLGLPVETTNSIGMKLVLIPPGEFEMGSTEAEIDAGLSEAQQANWGPEYVLGVKAEGPRHRVKITRPFCAARSQVTVGQFRKFVDATGYKTEAEAQGTGGFSHDPDGQWKKRPEFTWQHDSVARTDDGPVAIISWNDAQAFCKWMSKKEGRVYRLPTEAEWEYAARAGTTSRFSFGDDEARLGQHAWFQGNADRHTHPVGQKTANQFSLCGVEGNVHEWCGDWYDEHYYEQSPLEDPAGPATGSTRSFRGGRFNAPAGQCRVGCRRTHEPEFRAATIGFRVVCEIPDREAPVASE